MITIHKSDEIRLMELKSRLGMDAYEIARATDMTSQTKDVALAVAEIFAAEPHVHSDVEPAMVRGRFDVDQETQTKPANYMTDQEFKAAWDGVINSEWVKGLS